MVSGIRIDEPVMMTVPKKMLIKFGIHRGKFVYCSYLDTLALHLIEVVEGAHSTWTCTNDADPLDLLLPASHLQGSDFSLKVCKK